MSAGSRPASSNAPQHPGMASSSGSTCSWERPARGVVVASPSVLHRPRPGPLAVPHGSYADAAVQRRDGRFFKPFHLECQVRHQQLQVVAFPVQLLHLSAGRLSDGISGQALVRRQNKWDKRGAFKACNLDANRLRQFSDLPTSVRLDSFASPPVSSPVWRLAVRGTCPPA